MQRRWKKSHIIGRHVNSAICRWSSATLPSSSQITIYYYCTIPPLRQCHCLLPYIAVLFTVSSASSALSFFFSFFNITPCKPHQHGWQLGTSSVPMLNWDYHLSNELSVSKSGDPGSVPITEILTDCLNEGNACDPLNFEPNLALNIEVAELINTKKGNA